MHFGDYVFLVIISCSVYMVAVRLLDIVRGNLEMPEQREREVDKRTARAQQ